MDNTNFVCDTNRHTYIYIYTPKTIRMFVFLNPINGYVHTF